MKVKRFWLVTAVSQCNHKTEKVYYARNEQKAIKAFYGDTSCWYKNKEYIVKSVKPLEININNEI